MRCRPDIRGRVDIAAVVLVIARHACRFVGTPAEEAATAADAASAVPAAAAAAANDASKQSAVIAAACMHSHAERLAAPSVAGASALSLVSGSVPAAAVTGILAAFLAFQVLGQSSAECMPPSAGLLSCPVWTHHSVASPTEPLNFLRGQTAAQRRLYVPFEAAPCTRPLQFVKQPCGERKGNLHC